MQRLERAIDALPLVLVVITLIAIIVVGAMLESSDATSFRAVRTAAHAVALRASLLWMLSYVLLIVALFWNAFVAGAIAAAHLGSVGRRTAGVAAFLAMVAGGAATHVRAARPDSVELLINRATSLPIGRAILLTSTLGFGVDIVVLAAVVALGRRAPGVLSAAELRSRIAEARLLLFSTAALLAAGLVLGYLTVGWPADLPAVAKSPMPAALFQPLAVTVTLFSGVLYTAALIILFVPVVIIHELWIEESWNAASAEAAGLSRAKWLSENGLDRSLPATAAQIIAIAAPWLAAIGLPKLH